MEKTTQSAHQQTARLIVGSRAGVPMALTDSAKDEGGSSCEEKDSVLA